MIGRQGTNQETRGTGPASEPARTVVSGVCGVMVLITLLTLAALMAGCTQTQKQDAGTDSAQKAEATQPEAMVAGAKQGRISGKKASPDPIDLSQAAGDQVQWYNADNENLEINFYRGGPRKVLVPSKGYSRSVGVHEFPGMRHFPYSISIPVAHALTDTIGAPGDPEVAVGS